MNNGQVTMNGTSDTEVHANGAMTGLRAPETLTMGSGKNAKIVLVEDVERFTPIGFDLKALLVRTNKYKKARKFVEESVREFRNQVISELKARRRIAIADASVFNTDGSPNVAFNDIILKGLNAWAKRQGSTLVEMNGSYILGESAE